jgi:hypothetical protein
MRCGCMHCTATRLPFKARSHFFEVTSEPVTIDALTGINPYVVATGKRAQTCFRFLYASCDC